MPDVGVSREFLHRSCVQFSSSLENEQAVEAETKHAIRFARAHAQTHAGEIARALIWRVVDTDESDDSDRAGAWAVLNGVLAECGQPQSELSRTALADKIALFLPFLIPHRWFTTVARRDAVDETGDDTDADGGRDAAWPDGAAPGRRNRMGIDLAAYDKVVPADTINRTELKTLSAQAVFALTQRYQKILDTWSTLWRADMYRTYRQLVHRVRRHGNELSAQGRRYLEVPATFKDSLWRLRRKSPRPALALHVLYAFGWDPAKVEADGSAAGRPAARRLPQRMAEVAALDSAMHPGARQWLQQLVEAKGGCRLCDSWAHTEARCPCEAPFIRSAGAAESADHASEEVGSRRRAQGQRWREPRQLPSATAQSAAYMRAVDTLHRSGLALPLRAEAVLDAITQLIVQERPYEELVQAFDCVRGAVTGPEELHALWLHASYSLLPSRTVFDKPSDAALSPAVERAERFLTQRRRLREWDRLLRSVEVLDTSYRRRALPARAEKLLEEIRETSSFFLCLVDGSLPASYTPGKYARVPEEVLGAARLRHTICQACLEPFHALENCPHRKSGCGVAEPWDLQVARLVLEENGLDGDGLRAARDAALVDEATRRIDEDDRQAKDFRKCELALAIKLIVDGRVPFCEECRITGHSTRRCEVRARRLFANERLREVDVRLDPKHALRRIRELRQNGEETAMKELRDAVQVLAQGEKSYLRTYLAAIRELDDARIPLAAARYSTDAVQGFLLSISSGDLLAHLRPMRASDFPEVCLFCDSYHHRSEDCEDAKEDERGFLQELHHAGVSLWQYLRRPQFYDERLPTNYTAGKRSVVQLVQQFDEEYGPGGIARQKFIEHNGLAGIASSSQAGAGGAGALAGSSVGASQSTASLLPAPRVYGAGSSTLASSQVSSGSAITPLYGRSFSQLIEPPRQPSSRLSTDAVSQILREQQAGTRASPQSILDGFSFAGEQESSTLGTGAADGVLGAPKRARDGDAITAGSAAGWLEDEPPAKRDRADGSDALAVASGLIG